MKRFFYDILRDKGSVKFSITKVLALTCFIFFTGYLAYYLLWLNKDVDHTLIVELIGFMLTLLGFKNGWGVNKEKKGIDTSTTFEAQAMDSKTEDEADF